GGVHALAGRDPHAGALADGEAADAGVRADESAVDTLHRTRDERSGRAIAHELSVVTGREAHNHALGLRRSRESETLRELARLSLVAQLPDREHRPCELALPEHVQRVGLVLCRVTRAEQMR